MAITLQFVEKIDAVPTVRLDLAASPWSLLRKPDFSPPPLRRAVVSTLLRDGAEIPASAYDNRVLRLPLRVQAATEDLLATELTKLNRELDRSRNLLKWSSGGTEPVFFRTLRSPDYGLELRIVGTGEALIDLPVQAEPFAYGLKIELAAVAVNNDPAAASNGKFFEVSGVPGDVPTPLLLDVPGAIGAGDKFAVAVRRHGTPSDMTWFRQAESFPVSGADTGLLANDLAMSGTGSNSLRTTFGSDATLIGRFAGNIPKEAAPTAAEAKAWRGRYRVFLRARTNASGGTINLRMKYGTITGDTVSITPEAGKFWMLDLGLLSIPTGAEPPDGVGYGGEDLGAGKVSFSLHAGRPSGTSTIDFDYVLLVPADEELSIVQLPGEGQVLLDGPNDEVYLSVAGVLFSQVTGPMLSRVGSIARLAPNQVNRIAFGHVDQDSSVTAIITVTPSYWPRFLYIR